MPADSSTRTANVTKLYHPTLGVSDLEAARVWFRKVFGRPDLRWEDTLDLSLLEPDYPTNYSFFAFITDFHFVVLCPSLHATGALAGQNRYAGVPDGMIGIGWYTDEAVYLFEHLANIGFRSHDQKQQLITPENLPVSSIASDILVGFTYPEDAGLRHEFEELGERHREFYSRKADPRLREEWKPELDPNDPLKIVKSSHHTILTADLGRAKKLYLEGVNGRVVGEQHNTELDAESTYIHLGDAVVEFAVPDPGSPFADKVAGGRDHYYGISLIVSDQKAVEEHLRGVGCNPRRVSDSTLTLEPEEAFGMQWRFINAAPYSVD